MSDTESPLPTAAPVGRLVTPPRPMETLASIVSDSTIKAAATPSERLSGGYESNDDLLTTRLDQLWRVHSYINEYIRFADAKAALLLGSSGAILAWLWGERGRLPIQSTSAFGTAATIAMLTLVAAAICAAHVIAPRLRTKQSKGFIYWGSIREHGSREAFVAGLRGKRPAELQEQVGGHVFELAGIASEKYKWLAYGIWTGLFGGLATVAAVVLR